MEYTIKRNSTKIPSKIKCLPYGARISDATTRYQTNRNFNLTRKLAFEIQQLAYSTVKQLLQYSFPDMPQDQSQLFCAYLFCSFQIRIRILFYIYEYLPGSFSTLLGTRPDSFKTALGLIETFRDLSILFRDSFRLLKTFFRLLKIRVKLFKILVD